MDGFRAPGAAEFADQLTARSQVAIEIGQHCLLLLFIDPVEDGI